MRSNSFDRLALNPFANVPRFTSDRFRVERSMPRNAHTLARIALNSSLVITSGTFSAGRRY
jgi:hypothetical protein